MLRLTTFFASLVLAASAFGQATTEKTGPAAPAYQPPRERDAAGNVTGPNRVGWWNDVVFYEVFVRSFYDSRKGAKANDGIGDLQGLIDKLDYLNDGDPKTTTDLGIGGIWLMPIMESPSYHGYDITDYKKIEQDYGLDNDFRRLMTECHKRGIKVIVDLVMNHTSSKHPWFTRAESGVEPSRRDWYIFRADAPFKGPWGQQVWHPIQSKANAEDHFYYGLFGRDMPDLNFTNPAVSREMTKIVQYWLLPFNFGSRSGDPSLYGMGVDGFRLDAVRHLIEDGQQQDNTLATHEWLKNFRSFYKGVNPDAMCIGEIWAPTEVASSYVGDQIDLAFEFDLAQAIVDSAKAGDATRIMAAQAKVLKWFPPNQYGRFLTNHDQPRIMTQLKGDEAAAKVAATLLLTGPGVPFIYYGEELGMTGDKPDPEIRTPMQWSSDANAGFSTAKPWRAVKRNSETVNVEAEAAKPDSLLSLYKQLIKLRTEHAALAIGDYTPVETGNQGVLAFMRSSGRDDVLVVINLSNKEVADYTLSCEKSPMHEKGGLKYVLGGDGDEKMPKLNEQGAFSKWRPRDPLPPHHSCVIQIMSPP